MADPAGPFPDAAAIETLAALAGLNLGPERVAAVSAVLQAWRPGCLALSQVMRAPVHDAVVPATVLQQPQPGSTPADA